MTSLTYRNNTFGLSKKQKTERDEKFNVRELSYRKFYEENVYVGWVHTQKYYIQNIINGKDLTPYEL